MVSQRVAFGSATVLNVVGIAVLLYGVSLNSGTAVNAPMAAGGLILAAGVGIITIRVHRLESPE